MYKGLVKDVDYNVLTKAQWMILESTYGANAVIPR